MQQMLIDSSNVTLPTLGAAESGAAGRQSEVEAQAAAEEAEKARAEATDSAEQGTVRDEELGRTVDMLA